MEKIGLLIDSTSHTSEDLQTYDFIKTVNLKVVIDDEEYLEKDLSKEQMENFIEGNHKMLTSQPAPTDFIDAYKEFKAEGYTHVLVVVLSDKLSGTFQAALLSKNLLEDDLEVSIHSPQVASYGVANGLRILAKDIQEGITFEDLLKRYYQVFEHGFVSFTLSNLKHLFKGGRLSRVQALIGTVLRIKPIVEMIDGKLKMVRKERTNIACQDFFMEKVDEYAQKFEHVYIDIIHLNNEKWAESIKNVVEEKYPNIHIHLTDYVSPVFYVHLGNKGFGIALIGF
ncbi:DegV family protein [Hujiaoplasma nucleasis]|uniref:DegV family protein n=1 Tax=Hujiaoplasma nucleasis TaxID=2725268 RepID=A0A7L6N6F0_9MOLU|nr:DegV family protein [Hujiaoplasma nucleasis]QLY40575.1 DegV family protein [Hujiaoplasma nucleasis]